MNDTPTPRTDALMPDQGHKRTIYEHIQVMETHARQLEREIAQSKEANARLMHACYYLERELDEAKEDIEMLEIRHGATMLCHQAQMDEVTKQRDALAEALREIASGAYSWKTCVDVIAPKALAATKGGKP
jgi:septal ring factor EnvC (AmiA/AmiB activator)